MLLGLRKLSIRFVRHEKWLKSEMRTMLNRKKVQQYAREKNSGSHFPAPVAFIGPDGIYWTGDGFHRIEADYTNGEREIEVLVKPGTIKDAILFNLKANRENQGLSFAPGDISKSVKRLLTDKLFKNWTRFQISEAVGCSYSMVSVVAKKIGLPPAKTGVRPIVIPENVAKMLADGMKHQEVANKLGVSVRSIYRREISAKFEDCPHCHGSGKVLKQKQGVA